MSSNNPATPPPIKRSVLLKLKLQNLISKARSALKQAKDTVLNVAPLLMIAGSFLYLSAPAPEIRNFYLRQHVGSKVYMIKASPTGGGGTGFSLKAPSGITYIVTNSHVCEGVLSRGDDKTSVLVTDDHGSIMKRRVIEISDFTDLCLIEGLPGVEGLSVGDDLGVGDSEMVVGHPQLKPLTLSGGEIIGAQDLKILDHVMPTGDPLLDMLTGASDAACEGAKKELEEIKVFFLGQPITLKVCWIVTKGAYMATNAIAPGNSGSPVVDYFGKVRAVVFAMDSTGSSFMVSNKDLKKFISRY